jgi:ribonuclease P protein component
LLFQKTKNSKAFLNKKKSQINTSQFFFGKLANKDEKKLNISFVTKKKIGNAVKRNKIKRRLRNITNDAVKNIKVKFNYSYLVIAKPTMLNNEYTIIKETLFRDLERIR